MTSRRLDQQLVLGIAWVGGGRLMMQLLSWGVTLFVVRIISPQDYGIAGMAAIYVTLATFVTEAGIPDAVVAAPGLSTRDFAQLHALSLLLGIIGTAISLGLAWPLGAFFREPLLPPVVIAMSVLLLLNGARLVPFAVMQRNLQYRDTAIMQAARSLVQTSVVLIGALGGMGYWALALGAIGGSIAATIAVYAISRPTISRPVLARLSVPLHYARNMLLGRLAWQACANADFIVLGRTHGSYALGQYTLAWNVSSLPGEKLTNLLTIVAASFFAALRDDRAAMRRYFVVLTEGIGMLTFPILGAAAFVAADAIVLLWGEEWRPAILPMRLLLLYAMLNSLATPFTQVLTATGQVVAVRRNSIFTLALMAPAFYVAARTLGLAGVAAMWLALFPFVKAKLFRLVRETLSLGIAPYLAAVRPAALITGTMILLLSAVRVGFTHALDPKLRLPIEIASAAAATFIMLRLTYWNRLRTLWRIIRRPPSTPSSDPARAI